MSQTPEITIIGYDCGWGCRDWGCEDGPAAINGNAIAEGLMARGARLASIELLNLKTLGDHDQIKNKKQALPVVIDCVTRLKDAVKRTIDTGKIPVVIGGDHTSAIGTWSAIVPACGAERNFGLIWLDAHLDAHTPTTSHQGKWGGWWHGMPIAALTGHGVPEFVTLGSAIPKLAPAHISMIGIRSFEYGEKTFIKNNKIRISMMDEVEKRGFESLFDEALARSIAETKGFGLSIDLDGFDPEDAPGVGTGETGGLKAIEVLETIKGIGRHPQFKGLEIAEFNPHNDKAGKTAKLITSLILSCFDNPDN